jgi:hypothetical protein
LLARPLHKACCGGNRCSGRHGLRFFLPQDQNVSSSPILATKSERLFFFSLRPSSRLTVRLCERHEATGEGRHE